MKKLNFAILALMIVAGSANATLITQTKEFNLNNYYNYTSGTSYAFNDARTTTSGLEFDRFDSSLGSLNSVSISYATDYDHYLYASARDSQYESRTRTYYHCWRFGRCHWHYRYTYADTVSIAANSIAKMTIELTDPSSALKASSDVNSAGCTRSGSNSSSSCSDREYDRDNEFNGALDLSAFSNADFIGADSINVLLKNYASVSGTCSGNERHCNASSDVYWSGAVTVVYDFTSAAVPEPATVSLFGPSRK